MQTNKRTWLKWLVISCGIGFCITVVVIFVAPIFISKNFLKQKIDQTLAGRLESVHQVGPVSFNWPNRVNISYLIIQRQKQNTASSIRFENIQGTVKLLPLILKKIVVKKIDIREINYENRLLVKDLVTDKFSFENGIIYTSVRLNVNEGPTTIKGSVDLKPEKPVFDILINAKDINITQDVPNINLLPIFIVKEGEIGGVLSLEGSVRGKGTGKEMLNKKLDANINLTIKDGHISGNKLISSILEIIGTKDAYSFDLMEAVIQIKNEKIHTQKMNIHGHVMSLSASGTTEFEGKISYDAIVKFNKELLSKDIEKIADLVLKQNELPVEIRGTTKDPKVAVKISKDNLENLVKGLVSDFLDDHKEKHKKERESH